MNAVGHRPEGQELRIQNKDILRILDSLTPDDESPDDGSFRKTQTQIRAALSDHISIDVTLKGRRVDMRLNVCQPIRTSVESQRSEGDPHWDDPFVSEICKRIGLRLHIAVRIGRRHDFSGFLKYIQREGGTFHMDQFLMKRFKSIYTIIYSIMAKFEKQGESRDAGRLEIERFLTQKIREKFGGNMKVAIARGVPGILNAPKHLRANGPDVPEQLPQISKRMRELAGQYVLVRVTQKNLPLIKMEKGAKIAEGDLIKCLVANDKGRVYLASLREGVSIGVSWLTDEMEELLSITKV